MSILVDENTRLLVQGFTGKEATFHSEQMIKYGTSIVAGVPLGRWYPELSDCLLVAVTEKRTKDEIDRLAAVLGGAG